MIKVNSPKSLLEENIPEYLSEEEAYKLIQKINENKNYHAILKNKEVNIQQVLRG